MSKFANVMSFNKGNNHQQLLYDPTQAVLKVCECGCGRFAQLFNIGFISNLAPGNGTGKDIIIPFPIFICVNCGKQLGVAEEKPETTKQEEKKEG